MSEKFRATLHGNHLEWEDESPRGADKNSGVAVEVTIIEKASKPRKPNGKKMADALAAIAARGGIKSIPDPVKWQREIRKDRPLPGRK